MSHTFRYGRRATLIDTVEGAVGFAATGGVALFVEPAGAVAMALAAAAALFLLYFGRAVVRFLTRIELEQHGIRSRGPLEVAIPWNELRAMRLDHYTTRSDRSGGWMQLVVRGASGTIRIDSSLDGFAVLAAGIYEQALRLGHRPNQTTLVNLQGLGVALHD